MPFITVIMPVYNTEIYLREAIDSVMNQSFQEWELICVNDGSTDNSLEILRYYKALDKRIVVINQKHSGTAAAARNMALKNAKGEYMQMLDSDDLLSKDCLEKSYIIALSTQADLVVPDLIYFKGNYINQIYNSIGFKGNRHIVLSSEEAFTASLNWSISGVGLFRTKLVKKFQYDETGMNGDEYTTRLLLLNCNKIAFSEGAYYYRQHPESTTNKVSLKRFDRLLTDFRILKLAEEYQINEAGMVLCKKYIVDHILSLMYFYVGKRNCFNENERIAIETQLKTYYKKADRSFIVNEGHVLKFGFKNLLFINFEILKMYAYFRLCFSSNIKIQ